jgi:hypothetical protein
VYFEGPNRRTKQVKTLEEFPALLDVMISSQKEKKLKTYVAKYKGKNLIMRSGKSSWKAVNHAKLAILNHFSQEERDYIYAVVDNWAMNDKYTQAYYQAISGRERQFRAKLWELVEIVELKD